MSRSTDRLEGQLNETRDRLGDNLDEMGRRMTPGRMLDEAMDSIGMGPQDFADVLGNQVRRNPMATLLTAAGLAWLTLGEGRDPVRARMEQSNGIGAGNGHHEDDGDREAWASIRQHDALEDLRHRNARRDQESESDYYRRLDEAYGAHLSVQAEAGEPQERYRDRVRARVDEVRDRATRARQDLGRRAQATGRQAVASGRGAQARAAAYHEDNPLASGLIAAAVGALAGSMMPISRQEREALQPLAADMTERGAEIAEQAADQVERARDSAKQQMDQPGPA